MFGIQSDDGFELPAGNHSYNFACTLPEVLPSSFEGHNGHIRYKIKMILERPKKFDHTHKLRFTVMQQLNLNRLNPALRVSSLKLY